LSQYARTVRLGGVCGADVGGVVVGGVVVGGVVVGGATVGLVVGGVVLPVQLTPFRVKLAGTGLAVLFHEPLKPNDVLAFVASPPFQPALTAVTVAPDWVAVAFQACATVWPAVNDHRSVQPVRASPRLVTETFAEKPPLHCDPTA
jgi:hypothetical protein